MKRLVLIVLMFLPILNYGQGTDTQIEGFSISTEVDVSNLAQIGDGVNGYNGVLKVNYRNEMLQFGAFVETFPNRDFLSYGVEMLGVFNKQGRWNYLAGGALSLINRTTEGLTVYNAPSYTITASIEYNISKKFSTYTRLEHRYRGDINFLYDDGDNWVTSGFLGIKYKFN